MISQQILDYVRSQLQSGFSVEQVKHALKQQGWMDDEITDIINRTQSEIKQNIDVKTEENRSVIRGLGNILTGALLLTVGILVVINVQSVILNITNNYFPTLDLGTAEIVIWVITVLIFLSGIVNIISGIKLMK